MRIYIIAASIDNFPSILNILVDLINKLRIAIVIIIDVNIHRVFVVVAFILLRNFPIYFNLIASSTKWAVLSQI